MSAPIEKREHEFAFHLFNATRSIGMEQGSELVLQLLYLRFATETSARRLPVSSWRDFRDRLAYGAERPGRLLTATLEACLPGWSVSASQADIDDGQALSAATAALDHWDFPRADHPDALRAQASALYEAVLQVRSERLSRAGGEFETPASVARLMMGLLDSDAGVVLDPACGIATSLLEASRRPHSRLVGRDLSADAALRARMRLDLAGVDADIAVGDAFGYQAVAPESFDSVLLQPPWGQKLTEQQLATLPPLRYGKPGRSSADFVWLQLALRALGPGGRAAVLMPTGTLTRGGHGDADIRAQMLHDGLVEAVIGLPGNLLPSTGLPSCIWLLRGAAHDPVAPPVLLCSAATLAEPSTRHGLDLPDDAVTELLGIVHRWRNDPERFAAPAHLAVAVDVDELVEPGRLLPERHLSVPPTVKPVRPEPPRRLLTEVRLRNLKSFGDEQTVELAPITLIYGPNSAGKSSFLQSLLLLKQSLAANTLVTQGELTDAGSFVGALHRHDSERSLGIGLTFGALDRWEIPAGVPDPGLLRSVDFSFRSDGAGLPEQAEALISFGPHQAPFTRQPAEFGEGGDVPFGIDLDSARELFRAIGEGTLLFPFDSRMIQGEEDEAEARRIQQRRRNGDRAYKLLRDTGLEQLIAAPQGLLPGSSVDLDAVMPQLRAGREPGIVNSYVNRMMQLAVGVGSELRLLMSELTYLGPLRSAPQRFYHRAAAAAGAGTAGEHIALHLFDNSSEVDQVNEWLGFLELPYTLKVVPVRASGSTPVVGDLVAVVLTDRRSGVEVSPADVGFGVSQVLPIVVELLARRENVICIEQPEIHLHPKLQTELADLLIYATLDTVNDNQVIVETHSEHLLLRLQRRIREDELGADDVAVIYIDQDTDGEARVRRLRLDDNGYFIDPWPAGFFDEKLEELFEGIE